jgi:hypothetical protein
MLAAGTTPHREAIVVVVVAAGVYLATFLRSYRRNRRIYGRLRPAAVLIAMGAAWAWPATAFYWAFGPTPERIVRRRSKMRERRTILRRPIDPIGPAIAAGGWPSLNLTIVELPTAQSADREVR